MSTHIFLREHAELYVDLFDDIADADLRGVTLAAQILNVMDRAYEETGKPPSPDHFLSVVIQHGWFESELPNAPGWIGNCDHS